MRQMIVQEYQDVIPKKQLLGILVFPLSSSESFVLSVFFMISVTGERPLTP